MIRLVLRGSMLALLVLCISSSAVETGDYSIVTNSYGTLTHIAGTGQISSGNGWLLAMEGTNALQVELSRPHMTMADTNGNYYVADKEAHAILKITPDGNVHTIAGTHSAGNGSDEAQSGTSCALFNPNGLYVLPDGTTYILDKDNGKIRRLTPAGTIATIVDRGLSFVVGRGLWVNDDESAIYFGDDTIVYKWTQADDITTYATGFSTLGNIEMDPSDGTLVVTDPGAHQVFRILTNGTHELIAGNGSPPFVGDGGPATNAGLDEVRGIAFMPHGGYFLATKGDSDIWYVDTNNIAHVFIKGSDVNNYDTILPYDLVAEPRAISVAPSGDLIITENDHGVIRVVPRKLEIVNVSTPVSETVQLSWYSMPLMNYAVEFSESLVNTNWQSFTTIQGSSSDVITTTSDTNATLRGTGFYRIVTE